MAKLTLVRPDDNFPHRFTDYSIYVNGKHVVDLEKGNKETINVNSEEATVKAKVRWLGSQKNIYNLAKDNDLRLKISGNLFWNRLHVFFSMLIAISYFLGILLNNSNLIDPFLNFILILSAIGIVYIATIKRNSWLNISSLKDEND